MSIRVVYDTPVIVPRDEVVPALVINPHNPPPWLQNSTAQPQIIYVQQQQNYVQQQQQQTYVQQLDQNQTYLQQYGYQNPQMFIQNYDQLRQIQILPNIVQIPANHDPNDPNRLLSQTFIRAQNIQNPVAVQNQIALNPVQNQVQTQIVDKIDQDQQQSNERPPNIVQINPQAQEVQYANQQTANNSQYVPRPNQLRPRLPQQVPNIPNQRPIIRHTRPPRFAYQPIQPRLRYQVPRISVKKRFVQSSTMPNIINVSTVSPATNVSTNFVRPTTNVGTSINFIPTSIVPANTNVSTNIGPTIATKVTNVPATLGMTPAHSNTGQVQTPTSIQPINIVGPTITKAIIEPSKPLTINSNAPLKTFTPENRVSRKRKSESPDEIKNKLNILAINNSPILMGQLVTKVPEASKIDKIDNNSVSTQVQKEDLEISTTHGLVNQINLAQNQLKEKLVRNTVFTQARGRILAKNDKVETSSEIDNDLKAAEDTEVKLNESLMLLEKDDNIRSVNKCINKIDANDEMKLTDVDFVLTHVLDGFVIQESNIAFPIRKPTIEKTMHLSSEAVDLNPLDEKDLEDEIPSVAIVVSDRRKNGKDKENPKGVAKGKNSKDVKTPEKTKEKSKGKRKSDDKEIERDNCNENSNDCSRLEYDKDNPFSGLRPSAVKTWTVEQLTEHLSESSWKETSAAFFEHEIDGESLLLVSKSQLITIGVKEEHADIIINFINS